MNSYVDTQDLTAVQSPYLERNCPLWHQDPRVRPVPLEDDSTRTLFQLTTTDNRRAINSGTACTVGPLLRLAG
jgi:hypothetical protein